MRTRLRRVHARQPLWVNSGWRSTADQRLFFQCAQTKAQTGVCPPECSRSGCASANAPGESNHEAIPDGLPQALAVDMEPADDDWETLRVNCYAEKLHDPIPEEPWHWQPIEVLLRHYEGMPE